MRKFSSWILTGATGFVGQSLLRRWDREALPIDIVALCRPGSLGKIQPRTNRSGARLEVLAIGDFVSGNARPTYCALVHLAGLTKWSAGEEEALKSNYVLTVDLVDTVAANNPDARFVYCSTAMTQPYESEVEPAIVCGDRKFRNYYELSKFRAERYVEESGLPFSIVRPPLITGERGSGWCQGYQGLYHLLRLFARGFLPALPGLATSRINAVPSDDVANSILMAAMPSAPATIELIAGNATPSLEQFMRIGRELINCERYALGKAPIAPPRFISVEQWFRIFRPMLVRECGKRVAEAATILDHFLPYINITRQNTNSDATVTCTVNEDYFRSVVSYWAHENGHIVRKDTFDWNRGFGNGDRGLAGTLPAGA